MLFEAHLLPQFKHACRVIQEAFLFATPHDKIFTKCGRSVVTEILKVEIEEDIEGGGGGGAENRICAPKIGKYRNRNQLL